MDNLQYSMATVMLSTTPYCPQLLHQNTGPGGLSHSNRAHPGGTMSGSSKRGTSKAWKRITTAQRSKRQACYICGQPIDYDLQWPHPASFSADHIKPYAHHEELRLDPANVVSAHLRCNQSKGDNEHYSAGLGAASQLF